MIALRKLYNDGYKIAKFKPMKYRHVEKVCKGMMS